jgi:hypothetical protein
MRSCWSSSLGSIFCANEKDVLLFVVLRVLQRNVSKNYMVYNLYA